jgi:hypothetical protein
LFDERTVAAPPAISKSGTEEVEVTVGVLVTVGEAVRVAVPVGVLVTVGVEVGPVAVGVAVGVLLAGELGTL